MIVQNTKEKKAVDKELYETNESSDNYDVEGEEKKVLC